MFCFFSRHPPHRYHWPGKFGLLANGAAHGGVSAAAIAAKELAAAADVFFAEKDRRCVVFGLAMRTGPVSFHYMHYPRLSSMSSGEMYDRSGKSAQTRWRWAGVQITHAVALGRRLGRRRALSWCRKYSRLRSRLLEARAKYLEIEAQTLYNKWA